MNARAKVSQIYDYLPETPDDDLIMVPEGEYQLSYRHHATWLFRGLVPKLVVVYRICDFGEHYDKPILAYYNLIKIKGKPSKNGHFKVGWRSKFMWDYVRCFGKPPRNDQISMCRFKQHIVIGKVRTVSHNREQKEYPVDMRYSVVDEITGIFSP